MSGYQGLGRIKDPPTQAVCKSLFDLTAQLQRRLVVIEETALLQGSAYDAKGERLSNLDAPVAASDAVTLEYLRAFVEARFALTGALDPAYGQLSDSTNQQPGVLTPVLVSFNTLDALVGISYSGGSLTTTRSGIYLLVVGGQVGKTGGGGQNVLVDMWLRRNGVDLPNSGVRNSVTDVQDTKVVLVNYVVAMLAGDTLQVYISVDRLGIGAGLLAYTPAGEARIPSVMLTITRLAH